MRKSALHYVESYLFIDLFVLTTCRFSNMEYLVELLMPKLSREATEGEIQQWFKRPGQLVRKGESLAEVNSGNQTTVCRASDYGMLVEVLVEEGRPVSAGQVIARLHFNGELEVEDSEHSIESLRFEVEEVSVIDWGEVERQRMEDEGGIPRAPEEDF